MEQARAGTTPAHDVEQIAVPVHGRDGLRLCGGWGWGGRDKLVSCEFVTPCLFRVAYEEIAGLQREIAAGAGECARAEC